MSPATTLPQIRNKVMKCKVCTTSFKDIVLTHRFGIVSRESQDIFVIGERPGQAAGDKLELTEEEYEERVNRNFYGQFFEKLGLGFERAYFANLVKCAAEGNRKSTMEEVENCKNFLLEQLALKNPKVIIACGEPTVQGLTGEKVRVGKEAGRILSWNNIPLIVSPNPTGTYFKVNQERLLSSIRTSLESALGGKLSSLKTVAPPKKTATPARPPKAKKQAAKKLQRAASTPIQGRDDSPAYVVAQVSRHLEKMGAISKGDQKSKKGWVLDGEIINLQSPKRPSWFAFNKLRKLEKMHLLRVDSFCKEFGLTKDQIKDTGSARSAIWVHCSAGEEILIQIIDWLHKQRL